MHCVLTFWCQCSWQDLPRATILFFVKPRDKDDLILALPLMLRLGGLLWAPPLINNLFTLLLINKLENYNPRCIKLGHPVQKPDCDKMLCSFPLIDEFFSSVMPILKNQHWEGRKHHNCPNYCDEDCVLKAFEVCGLMRGKWRENCANCKVLVLLVVIYDRWKAYMGNAIERNIFAFYRPLLFYINGVEKVTLFVESGVIFVRFSKCTTKKKRGMK